MKTLIKLLNIACDASVSAQERLTAMDHVAKLVGTVSDGRRHGFEVLISLETEGSEVALRNAADRRVRAAIVAAEADKARLRATIKRRDKRIQKLEALIEVLSRKE